jgi:hypothetical protein
MSKKIEYGLNAVSNFRLLNFATGTYSCICLVCQGEFIGDKRACQCLSCALKQVEEMYQKLYGKRQESELLKDAEGI